MNDPLTPYRDRDVPQRMISDLLDMIRSGDLHHIDGAMMRDLTDLADHGHTERDGWVIEKVGPAMFRITMGRLEFIADSALYAVLEAREAQRTAWLGNRRAGWKAAA